MLPLALSPFLLKLLLLLGQRASSRTFDHLFVWLPSLCLSVCLLCTRLSTHFSAVHSVVIVCAWDVHLLFKLQLKFRKVLKHTESRNSFACSQNIKDIPTTLEVFLCFETKRNETKRLLLGVEDTGHATIEHRPTNLLFLLYSSFFCPFVLYCSLLSKNQRNINIVIYS